MFIFAFFHNLDREYNIENFSVDFDGEAAPYKVLVNTSEGWVEAGSCDSKDSGNVVSVSRSAVLMIHGEKAHSCYFSKDAFADMTRDSKYTANKELMIIPGAVHTDLYDGGGKDAIPFDKMVSFFTDYLK